MKEFVLKPRAATAGIPGMKRPTSAWRLRVRDGKFKEDDEIKEREGTTRRGISHKRHKKKRRNSMLYSFCAFLCLCG